jgi:hypothetical protein
MELSRFHYAVDQISADCSFIEIHKKFFDLVANLNSLVANPGNPQVSQSFKDQLDSFRIELENSGLNHADGDLLATINNLNLHDYVGQGLYNRIRKILEENQLTPNLASASIDALSAETIKKLDALIAINTHFSDLKVEYTKLDDGKSEMAIEVPMEEETKTLEDLSKEAKDWHQICEFISETFDIDRSRVTIRTVSTGSILLYLAATAAFIFGVAKCLKGVNSILAEVIKAKNLYKQLSESQAPNEALEILEAHNSNKAKKDLVLLASQLVDEYYKGNDEGRKNELKTGLSISLQRLSHKLATGAKVNLRLAAPKKPKIEDGQVATKEQEMEIEKITQLEKIQVEIASSKASLDYNAHSAALTAALPAPMADPSEK